MGEAFLAGDGQMSSLAQDEPLRPGDCVLGGLAVDAQEREGTVHVQPATGYGATDRAIRLQPLDRRGAERLRCAAQVR
jgi:hypothetical protein